MQQDEGLSQGSSASDSFCSNFCKGKSSVMVRFSVLALLVVGMVGGASADTVYRFDTCGEVTGYSGPSQSECDSAYSGTNLQGLVTVEDTGWQEITLDSGKYEITVVGAQGGDGGGAVGKSAKSSLKIELTDQKDLNVLVGQRGVGKDRYAGGGGGSFVWFDGSTTEPLIAAGGTGGSIDTDYSPHDSPDAPSAEYGVNPFGNSDATNGNGGSAGYEGGGGGGWKTAGGDGSSDCGSAQGGRAIINGGLGGHTEGDAVGGFGGGGQGGACWYAGGSGGGYSGGSGEASEDTNSGGSGGSYVASSISGGSILQNYGITGGFWSGGAGYVEITAINNPPQFNSTSVNPDPPLIGENVSYGAEVFDSDGPVDYTNLTLEYGGSTVLSDEQRTGTTTPSWNDVFTPQTGNKWLNATLEVVDDAGAVTTTRIDRYLSNDAPNVNVVEPSNSTFWSYDVPLNVEASDSDSNPGETFTCTVDKDGSQVDSFTIEEGVNTSYSSTVRSDLGSHALDVSCTDPAGNTGTDTENYEVKSQEFVGQTHPSPVFESKTPQSNIEVEVGEMVNDLSAELVFNGSVQDSNTGSRSDHGNIYLTGENSGVPIVQSNNTAVDVYWSYEVNRTKVDGGSVIDTYTSPTESQSIYHAVHSPSISTDSERYIEKEDVDTTLDYTDEGFNGDISCETTVNGTTKNGLCSESFDSGLVSGSNKKSIGVEGEAVVSFDGDNRSIGPVSKDVDVYRKIITDGSNAEFGVTGTKALEFELLNEENRSQSLTGNIDYNFDVTHHGDHSRNYAFENTGVKTASVYMYPDWAEYSISGPVQYSSDSSQNTNDLNYPDRQYNLFNQSLNTDVESVDLYLLDESFTTPVYFEVTDQGGNPVPGASVTVQRYFIGSNSYLTVAKSETDSDGVATTYMRVNEIYYKYTVTDKDGNVLLNTDRQILTCQSSPCSKELRVNPEADNPYFTDKEGFEFSTKKLTNDAGNLTGFQATVSHSDDVFKQASLNVDREKAIGKENICDITASSNPTTLVCEFDEPAGDDRISYSLTAETNSYEFTLDTGILNEPGNLFGDNAYFAGFIIFAMLSMIGVATPKTGIMFSTAGILVPWYLGFYQISLAAVGSLVIVAIALVVTSES